MQSQTPTPLRRRTVGEVVAEDYRLGAVFKRFGIDFCCGGGLPIEEACERQGVSYPELESALESAQPARAEGQMPDTRGWPPAFLADYIVNVHHRYCRETLPVLEQFTQKVARVHGPGRPALVALHRTLMDLSHEMEAHMTAEEEEVFPAIRAPEEDSPGSAAAPGSAARPDPPTAPGPDLLARMEDEHETAGGLMAEIRRLSDDFTPPEGACATWRAAYAKLEEFESDLHRHVHLENNVLFPAVRAG